MSIPWVAAKAINHERISSLLNDSSRTNQFANYGPNVARLEETIRQLYDIDADRSVIAVVNGSAAIQVLTAGIGVCRHTTMQWATQSFTFPSSVQGSLFGTKIVDVDAGGGLDLTQVDDDVDGLIVTNIFGNVVDIDRYVSHCLKHNQVLVFDNAATHYTTYKGKNALNYGTGSTLSFHHTKPMGFGEGGAIIVDRQYEDCIRRLMNFGIGLPETYWAPEGNNFKMSEVSAVYILQYLEREFEHVRQHNQAMFECFKALTRARGITAYRLYPSFHDGTIMPSCICILFERGSAPVLKRCLDAGIQARKYYHPLDGCPMANSMYKTILALPCHADMKTVDIEKMFDVVTQDL